MNTGAGEDQAAKVGRVPTPDSETFWISHSHVSTQLQGAARKRIESAFHCAWLIRKLKS